MHFFFAFYFGTFFIFTKLWLLEVFPLLLLFWHNQLSFDYLMHEHRGVFSSSFSRIQHRLAVVVFELSYISGLCIATENMFKFVEHLVPPVLHHRQIPLNARSWTYSFNLIKVDGREELWDLSWYHRTELRYFMFHVTLLFPSSTSITATLNQTHSHTAPSEGSLFMLG